MYFFEKGNYIVLFGGRKLVDPKSSIPLATEFVNKVSLLQLSSLEWFSVNFKENQDFPELYNYATSRFGDKVIIFGGMNKEYKK